MKWCLSCRQRCSHFQCRSVACKMNFRCKCKFSICKHQFVLSETVDDTAAVMLCLWTSRDTQPIIKNVPARFGYDPSSPSNGRPFQTIPGYHSNAVWPFAKCITQLPWNVFVAFRNNVVSISNASVDYEKSEIQLAKTKEINSKRREIHLKKNKRKTTTTTKLFNYIYSIFRNNAWEHTNCNGWLRFGRLTKNQATPIDRRTFEYRKRNDFQNVCKMHDSVYWKTIVDGAHAVVELRQCDCRRDRSNG